MYIFFTYFSLGIRKHVSIELKVQPDEQTHGLGTHLFLFFAKQEFHFDDFGLRSRHSEKKSPKSATSIVARVCGVRSSSGGFHMCTPSEIYVVRSFLCIDLLPGRRTIV